MSGRRAEESVWARAHTARVAVARAEARQCALDAAAAEAARQARPTGLHRSGGSAVAPAAPGEAPSCPPSRALTGSLAERYPSMPWERLDCIIGAADRGSMQPQPNARVPDYVGRAALQVFAGP